MEFRIANTFTDSLARLTGDEQRAVKTTAFDLQLDPTSPGMQFHRLERARDRNFWSVRVSRDVRLIVHRTESSLLLCYVDHHDNAYAWAARRKLETHPRTGAAQLVEIRETIREISIPAYVAVGAFVWLAVFESGVHATIAGVVLGLITPAKPLRPDAPVENESVTEAMAGHASVTAVNRASFEIREQVSVAHVDTVECPDCNGCIPGR